MASTTTKQLDSASPHKDADDDYAAIDYAEVSSPVKKTPSAPPAEWPSEHQENVGDGDNATTAMPPLLPAPSGPHSPPCYIVETAKQQDERWLSSPHEDAPVDYDAMDCTHVRSPVLPSAPPPKSPSEQQRGDLADEPPSPLTPPMWPTFAPPELLPPSARAKRGLAWLTLKLVPYHALNFALGMGAFCAVLTGLCLAGGLLPLCCVGVPIYFLLLQFTRTLVAMDVALANTITRAQACARWNVSDEIDDGRKGGAAMGGYELRIAPKLTKLSVRSTVIIAYFLTAKLALGVASLAVVCMPFLPLASEIASHTTRASDHVYVAGWDVHMFNFGTHPVWFTVVFIVYVVVGVALMHFLGLLSRETTRRVCCVEVVVPPREGATLV